MTFDVVLTDSARADIEAMWDYIVTKHGESDALYVLDRLEETLDTLETFPSRGHVPAELAELGITAFREIFFKPYRVIYAVEESAVVVYLVADGRRDMRSILERRLLER